MDPVTIAGLVSSIITILQTTKDIYDAANNQSGLPEAFKVVATRLDAVTTILPTVRESIEHVDEIELKQSLVKLLRSCESQSTSLHDIFRKVVPGADAKRMERYTRAARALKVGRAARVEDLMKSIITDMHTISMDLGFLKSASEVQSLLQAQEAVEKLEPSLPDEELDGAPSHHVTTNHNTGSGNLYSASGSGNMTNFSNNASQHNYSGSAPVHHVQNATYGPPPKSFPASKLLRASPPVNPPKEDLDRLRHKSEPTAATYDWLTSVPEYSEWLNTTAELPILVITGVPGSGKTCVSMSWAITFCHRPVPRRQNHTASAYYFCDGKDKGRSSGTAVLRGLLYQLCNANLDVTIPNQLLQRAWEAWVDEGDGDQKSRLPSSDDHLDRSQWWNNFDSLWNLFKEIVAHPDTGNFILLIDAVDEYEEATRRILLSRLSRFQADSKRIALQGKVKFLLTCRKVEDLDMTRMEYKHIRLKTGPGNRLLGPHIRQSIETMFQICHFEPEFTEERIAQIQSSAEGTFLWISFLLSDLRKICVDRSIPREEKRLRIDDAIQSMPLELAQKYDQILDGIPKGDFSEISTILQILALATKPMTKGEVRMALELIKMPWEQLHHPTGDTWSKEDEEHMYESCADLVHVYQDAAGRETVSLIHQSLKQHLLHLDRHVKKMLLCYAATIQIILKWMLHAVFLGVLGLATYYAATIHERHTQILPICCSACYLGNMLTGCILYARTQFSSAGHRSFDWWMTANFGADQDLLTAKHSLEHIMIWLSMGLSFVALIMYLVMTVMVAAVVSIDNWKYSLWAFWLPVPMGLVMQLTVNILIPKLNKPAQRYWESAKSYVVTRRRGHGMLWEVCAKRIIIFLAEQTYPTMSDKQNSEGRSCIGGKPDKAQNHEASLASDDLFVYALENFGFHVYDVPRGLDHRGYGKLKLPCDQKALDCYPRFRGWWLNHACYYDAPESLVQALLHHGADVNEFNLIDFSTLPHIYGTPLDSAISSLYKSQETVQILLDHGALVSKQQQDELDQMFPNVRRAARLQRIWRNLVSGHVMYELMIHAIVASGYCLLRIIILGKVHQFTGEGLLLSGLAAIFETMALFKHTPSDLG